MALDVDAVRRDFPVLSRRIGPQTICYLDSAATSLKPRQVVDAMVFFETNVGANVHRGGHALGDEASELFESARADVGSFLNVPASDVIFTSSATMGLNLVALGLAGRPGTNVVTDAQQHHAAILPWYGRAEVRFVDVGRDGEVAAEETLRRVDDNTCAVILSSASNVTGRRHELKSLLDRVRERGVLSIVDGAQSVAHGHEDIQALGCDFFAFSGHKMLGPTGVGVLTGRRSALERLGQPFRGGGSVRHVGRDAFSARALPHKLEVGTPPIAATIGLAAAVRYVGGLDQRDVAAHERSLTEHMVTRALRTDGFALLGPTDPAHRIPLVSLTPTRSTIDVDAVSRLLSDRFGIMVRSGHMCTHPFFDGIGASGALRVSAHLYTSHEEIDRCFDALASATRSI